MCKPCRSLQAKGLDKVKNEKTGISHPDVDKTKCAGCGICSDICRGKNMVESSVDWENFHAAHQAMAMRLLAQSPLSQSRYVPFFMV